MTIIPGVTWVPSSGGSTGVPTHSINGEQTQSGSLLLLSVVCRDNTSTIPVVSDVAGNLWEHAVTYRNESQSTLNHIMYVLNAAPISQLTWVIYTGDGINGPTASHGGRLTEFLGVSAFHKAASGVPTDPDTGLPVTNVQTGSTINAPSVDAPVDALVFSSLCAGISNRVFAPVGVGWTEVPGLYSSAQMRNWNSYTVTPIADLIVPKWTLVSGTATGAGTSTVVFTSDPNAGSPISINVGSDLTVGAANNTQISATVSGGEGSREFNWTIESGPSGDAQLLGASNQTVTFDPSGTSGVYVIRCTVTDLSGSAFDELTLTVLNTLSYLSFETIDTSAGWTINGGAPSVLAALSDNDVNTSVTSPEDPIDHPLGGLLKPLLPPDQPLIIRFEGKASDGTVTAQAVGRLYVGETLKATSSPVSISVGEDSVVQVDVPFPLSSLAGITAQEWQNGVRAIVSFTAE